MFDIGWDEMALVAVMALLIIGPKDLPHVLRTAGHWVRKARSLAGEFQRGVDEMVRESELHDLKAQVEKVADTNSLRREVEKAVDPTGDIARGLEPPRLDAPAAQAEAGKPADGGSDPGADMGAWNEPPDDAAPAMAEAAKAEPTDQPIRPPQP